jgi:hypothetical protein
MVRASAAGVCASRCVVAISLAVGSGSVRHGERLKCVKVKVEFFWKRFADFGQLEL